MSQKSHASPQLLTTSPQESLSTSAAAAASHISTTTNHMATESTSINYYDNNNNATSPSTTNSHFHCFSGKYDNVVIPYLHDVVNHRGQQQQQQNQNYGANHDDSNNDNNHTHINQHSEDSATMVQQLRREVLGLNYGFNSQGRYHHQQEEEEYITDILNQASSTSRGHRTAEASLVGTSSSSPVALHDPEHHDITPRYLGPNALLYNKYYLPLHPSLQHDLLPIDLYATTPLPASFPDYEAYENTLLNWLEDVYEELRNLGSGVGEERTRQQPISLPHVTGRCYYRPQVERSTTVPSAQRNGSSTLHSSKLATSAAATTSYASNIGANKHDSSTKAQSSTFASQNTTTPSSQHSHPDSKSPSAAPTTTESNELWWEALYSSRQKPTWDATLVPPEPNPYEFSYYEQYQNAMMRWAILCRETMDPMPPHPTQFGHILGLQTNGRFQSKTLRRCSGGGFVAPADRSADNQNDAFLLDSEQHFAQNKSSARLSLDSLLDRANQNNFSSFYYKEDDHLSTVERTGNLHVVKNYWTTTYSEKTKLAISKAITNVLNQRNVWRERYGGVAHVTPPPLPMISGRFCSSDPIQKSIKLDESQIEFIDVYPEINSTRSWMRYSRKALQWSCVFLPLNTDATETQSSTLESGESSSLPALPFHLGASSTSETPYSPSSPYSHGTPPTPVGTVAPSIPFDAAAANGGATSLTNPNNTLTQHSELHSKLKRSIQNLTASNLPHQHVLPHQNRSLEDYHECSGMEQDRPVDFTVPDFELGCIDFSLLQNGIYSQYLKQLLTKVDNCTRLFHLYSWNYPSIAQMIHEMHHEHLIQCLHVFCHSQTEEALTALFCNDAYFDIFRTFLHTDADEDLLEVLSDKNTTSATQIGTLLINQLDNSQLEHVLNLFENSGDEMTHAKVSGFVIELLHTERGSEFISNLLHGEYTRSQTVHFLFHIANALSFFHDIPLHVHDFDLTCQHIIRERFGETYFDLISTVYIVYYSVMICSCIDGENPLLQPPKSYFGEIYKLLIEYVDASLEKLCTSMRLEDASAASDDVSPLTATSQSTPQQLDPSHQDEKPPHLLYDLFTLLTHQSKRLSECAEFLLIHILEYSYFCPSFKSLLISLEPFTALRNSITPKRSSTKEEVFGINTFRMKHVQNSVRRVFRYMCQSSVWSAELQDYCLDASNLVHDCIERSAHCSLIQTPALISTLICDYICQQLTITEYEPAQKTPFIQDLLERGVFNQILNKIKLPTETPAESNAGRHKSLVIHQGTSMGARILSFLARYSLCIDAIAVHDPDRKKAKKSLGEKQKSKSKIFKTKSIKKGFSRFIVKKKKGPKNDSPASFQFIEVSSTMIQDLLDLISVHHSDNVHSFQTKNHLLNTLRYILKHQDTFAQRPANFTQTLLDLCSQGEDISFNRNCWRLWYQVIKYHPSELDRLIHSKQIAAFIRLIGSDNMFICTNALRYLGKTLLLLESSQPLPRILYKRNDSHDNLKCGSNKVPAHIQKQHKAVIETLITHLGQHLQLLCTTYKKLVPGTQPFQSLVRVYEIIYCHSETKKLLEQIHRDPEFHKIIENGMAHIWSPMS